MEPLASTDKMSSLNTLIYAKKSASLHLIARDFQRCVEVCKSSISDLLQNSPAISEMERYDVYMLTGTPILPVVSMDIGTAKLICV